MRASRCIRGPGSPTDAGKGLAMTDNSRPGGQLSGGRVDIGQSRIAAHGQRRVRAGGRRRLAWFSQWSMSVLRCSLQQTLFIPFCEASAECQERILRRSSQRFSPPGTILCAKGVEAANGARRAFCDWLSTASFDKQSSVDRGVGQEAWTVAR